MRILSSSIKNKFLWQVLNSSTQNSRASALFGSRSKEIWNHVILPICTISLLIAGQKELQFGYKSLLKHLLTVTSLEQKCEDILTPTPCPHADILT